MRLRQAREKDLAVTGLEGERVQQRVLMICLEREGCIKTMTQNLKNEIELTFEDVKAAHRLAPCMSERTALLSVKKRQQSRKGR